ncbi:MAG TPA: ABC transporter ATP-binding protein [Candidatus Saccharimonadales bacterium]|nr:ABC transporter ATP-binding protein [Candidatus Saccharimonadales bacterium]
MKKRRLTNPVLAFYWRHMRRYPWLLIGAAISSPLAILFNNYLPTLILATVLSRLSQHKFVGNDIWHSFGPLLLLYVGTLFLSLLMWRVLDFMWWRMEARVQQDLSEEVFDHMLKESADFHANNFTGSLVSQTNKILGGYIRTADTTLFMAYPLVSGIVIISVIIFKRSPIYVLGLIVFALLFILVAAKISRPVRDLGAKHAAAESRQTGYLADAITNIMVIKSFARGDYERERFRKATTSTRQHLHNFARIHQVQMNSLGSLSRAMSSLALFAAVTAVMIFHANIATVFLMFSYTASVVDQLFQFSNNGMRNYNRAIGDAAEMVEILAQTPVVLDPEKPEKVRISRGAIDFKKVGFTHAGSEDALFNNFSLRIKPGEKVGLVGHSGSGKTTFTRLLLRFSDIQSGSIEIDGQNIARITQDDLHSTIAYVPQEPLLFHRTIAENIGYGELDAPIEAIKGVAKLSHAAEFIEQLPQGYDTLVGERGVKLSGGQRQRVAIARAMLKNAPILVLDEATSALDSESEVLIQDALWKLMEGRTAIVIAHRLSTIQKMDRIVVLENGEIVEQGSHKELLAANGRYATLWAHQSGGFIED